MAMATVTKQRDLLKRETFLNLARLSRAHPMIVDLSRPLFTENALEKLTQNVFYHLTYYLVSIVDQDAKSRLPWPLFDSKTERTYRNELSNIISEYSTASLLSPVMSSYLVNPGCYKVAFLIYQLSQLAVQSVLLSKNDKKLQIKELMEKYKYPQDDGFIEATENITKVMTGKLTNHLHKKQILENMAEIFRNRITRLEETYVSLNTEEFLDNLVDNYVEKCESDCKTKKEILKIKYVNEKAQFCNAWFEYFDFEIEKLESNWDCKMTPILEASKKCKENMEELIARHTGEIERKTFTIEYNSKTDEICNTSLLDQVNSEQKYVLKNIVKDNKLNFPNLIRGCMISLCFVLKDIEIGEENYRLNENLEEVRKNYGEINSRIKMLIERVMKVEKRLELTRPTIIQLPPSSEWLIPPLPDLSGLKMNSDDDGQVLFDTLTPWNTNKYQFNLRRKRTLVNRSFIRPAPRTLMFTPFHHQPRDDLMKSILSYKISAYDCQNTIQMQNMHNLSIISQTTRGNETIAECSTGFTKQQLNRILSTKKSSSMKKHKSKTDRPLIGIKKGGLFNESIYSDESIVLTRSQSSPNLFENRDKQTQVMARTRKLSIMKEDSPSHLEVSGIAALGDSYGTPQGGTSIETSRKLKDFLSLPHILITPTTDEGINKVLNGADDFNKEIINESIEIQAQPTQQPLSWKQTEEKRRSIDFIEQKSDTPKTSLKKSVGRTNSLEKIINRFKKVRTSNLPTNSKQEYASDIQPICEEKENLNTVNVDVFTANRNLLPDLVSPSCSVISNQSKSNDDLEMCLEDDKKPTKGRESLGTALGVDYTFLDYLVD